MNSQLFLIVETERPKNGIPPSPTVVHPVYLQTASLKLIFTISLKYLDRGFVAKFLRDGFSAMFATQLNIPGLRAL